MAAPPNSDPRVPVDFRPAWRRADPQMEQDAQAFWIANNLLPPGETLERRVRELCVVGYTEGKVSVVSTAAIRRFDFLGCKLAMFRCAVAPEYRRSLLARAITVEARKELEAWSAQNKAEEIMGMGAVVQDPAWDGRVSARASLRNTGLVFIGFTAEGEAMRVAWFEEARVFRRERRVGYET